MKIPRVNYGKVEFDAFKGIPWDFKAHAMNTSSHKIIVNDREATAKGIIDYQAVGVILALGKVLLELKKIDEELVYFIEF